MAASTNLSEDYGEKYYYCGVKNDEDDRFSPDEDDEFCPMVGLCGHTFCKKNLLATFTLMPQNERKTKFGICPALCRKKLANGKEEWINAFEQRNLVPNKSLCEALKAIEKLKAKLIQAKTQEEKIVILKWAEKQKFQKCMACNKEYTTQKKLDIHNKYHDQAPIVGKCGHTFCSACLYDAHQKESQARGVVGIKNFQCIQCDNSKAFHSLELFENQGFLYALRYWHALRQEKIDPKKEQQEESERSPEASNGPRIRVKEEDPCSQWSIMPSEDAREKGTDKTTCVLVKQEPEDNDTPRCDGVGSLRTHRHQEEVSMTIDEEQIEAGCNDAQGSNVESDVADGNNDQGAHYSSSEDYDNKPAAAVDGSASLEDHSQDGAPCLENSEGEVLSSEDGQLEECNETNAAALHVHGENQEKEVIELLDDDSDDDAADTDAFSATRAKQGCRQPTYEQGQHLRRWHGRNRLTFLCWDEFKLDIQWHIYYRYDRRCDRSRLVFVAPDSYVRDLLGNRQRYNHMILRSKPTHFRRLQYKREENKWLVETFNGYERPVDKDFVEATFRREFRIRAEQEEPNTALAINPWCRIFPRINLKSATFCPSQSIKYVFKESSDDWKLMYSFASALDAMGLREEASWMYDERARESDEKQMTRLVELVSLKRLNYYLQHKVINEGAFSKSSAVFERSDAVVVIRPKLACSEMTCFLVVYNGLIFEPTSKIALRLTKANLDICCGRAGQFLGIKESWTLLEKSRTKNQPNKKRKAAHSAEVIEIDD